MLVQYLIEKGSHLSHKGVGGLDALHVAVRAGNVQIVFLLLSGGSYVDSQDECHDTPFHWCLKVGSEYVQDFFVYFVVLSYVIIFHLVFLYESRDVLSLLYSYFIFIFIFLFLLYMSILYLYVSSMLFLASDFIAYHISSISLLV